MPTLEQEKEELLKRLAEITAKEESGEEEKMKEQNYKDFLDRKPDLVVGKAHHQTRNTKTFDKPNLVSVSVSGSCSHVYKDQVSITTATNTYFHNVWTDDQRYDFQQRLTEFVEQEVNKIIANPHQVVELMGLQYKANLRETYPKDKIKAVEEEIKKAQWEVLDKFSDDELMSIPYDLSHGGVVLADYLMNKRQHLFEKRKTKTRRHSQL